MRDLHGWAKARHAGKKTAKWTLILGALGVVALAAVLFVGYQMTSIPDPNADFQAETTTVYYSDGQHVLGTFALQNRHSVPLSEVPLHVQHAVIAAENRSFYSDPGISVTGTVRAAWHDLTSDTTHGGSTITQQYVKVLYLTQQRTWERKIKEAFLSLKIDRTLGKKAILQGYLNTIYFGRGAYGIDAAAHAYFDKPAADLTVREGAVLAAVLNSPGNLDPAGGADNRQRLLGRYQYVLDGMADMGDLTPQQAHRLGRRLPHFPHIKTSDKYGGQKGYLLTLVRSRLHEHHFSDDEIDGGGLNIVTTFDYQDMQAARKAVRQVPPKKKALHVALASVEPGSGALRAMIGGKDYLTSQYNWAVHGGQPGSSFKPYALAAALRDGYTLQDTFDGNSPFRLPDGTLVHNEGESSGHPNGFSYGSNVSLLYATQESINTAYVDLTTSMDDGPQKVVDAMTDAGIPRHGRTRGLHPNPVVALGTATVSVIDQANGYATFAAGGERADWYVIEKVTDRSGLRYQHDSATTRAFSPAVTSNVTAALRKVVEAGTGTRARALGRPAAGKTGTATAVWKDGEEHVSSAWFVGYTPQLSTAVMFVRGDGNDPLDGGYLDPFYGGTYPCQTWTTYMTGALRGTPVRAFPEPATLTPHHTAPTRPPSPRRTTRAPETPTSSATAPRPTDTASATAPRTTPTTTRATTTTAPTTTAPTTTTPTTTHATQTQEPTPTSTGPSTTRASTPTAPPSTATLRNGHQGGAATPPSR